nr:MAG TPA: hypothetical protein [Caudoviricetes sp.]
MSHCWCGNSLFFILLSYSYRNIFVPYAMLLNDL